jgi:hypothetical protein
VTTNLTVANEASDTTCFIVFTPGPTGTQAPKTNSTLTIDSSTGTIGVPYLTVSGDHDGATGNPRVVNVIYGTGDPPAVGTLPDGTIYLKYTAP